jgi:DNA-binding helix-hairpin-helix protein with protein kinase domain
VDVVIENERASLADLDLIGQGGEGRVYRLGARAVKIFHSAPKEKIAKLEDFPRGLPDGVVSPLHLVRDPRSGAIVGYTMKLLSGATDALRLSQRRFRHGAVSNACVCAILRRLHEIVGRLHARSVVVGDLNDGNVVFTGSPSPAPWLIDCDSMQFGRHACTVAHERFLDPRLFGVDLARAPAFDQGTDWYAFAVLAFIPTGNSPSTLAGGSTVGSPPSAGKAMPALRSAQQTRSGR